MANVKYTRGNTAFIAGTTIQDGQMLFNTTTGQQYLDIGASTRKEIGKVADTTLSTTSTNAVANSAITGSIVNTMADVNAITNNYIPCGTNAVKELSNSFGWTDITSQCTWDSHILTSYTYHTKVNEKIRMIEVSCVLNAGRANNTPLVTLPSAYRPSLSKNMGLGVAYDSVKTMEIEYYLNTTGAIVGAHTIATPTGTAEFVCFNFTY